MKQMENYNLISAEIVADSLNQFGERITTMKLIFPRIILAEFNTHRMFNRNSTSSRAIPFHKMVKAVQENPFIPIAWQKHHSGMQGNEYHTGEGNVGDINYKARAERNWLRARDFAVEQAKQLYEDSLVTEQLSNRLLEPFMWTTMLITGSKEGWDNFHSLRCPQYLYDYENKPIYFKSKKDWINYYNESQGYKEGNPEFTKVENLTSLEWLQFNKGQAEIHMMALAEKIYDAVNESTPKQLKAGEWHIPFGDNINEEILFDTLLNLPILDGEIGSPVFDTDIINAKIKVATARCARISYETLGDNPEINYEKDIKLHDDLLAMKHMSPFEHCAVVMNEENYYSHIKTTKAKSSTISNNDDIYIDGPISFKDCGWSRNFKGFKQYREIIE